MSGFRVSTGRAASPRCGWRPGEMAGFTCRAGVPDALERRPARSNHVSCEAVTPWRYATTPCLGDRERCAPLRAHERGGLGQRHRFAGCLPGRCGSNGWAIGVAGSHVQEIAGVCVDSLGIRAQQQPLHRLRERAEVDADLVRAACQVLTTPRRKCSPSGRNSGPAETAVPGDCAFDRICSGVPPEARTRNSGRMPRL